MRISPQKILFIGLLITAVLYSSSFVLAALSSVVRNGIVNEDETSLWGDGDTDVPTDGYFKWQHLNDAGSYVLRIKRINSLLNPDDYLTRQAYLNAACTQDFPSEEDSIPIPSPGNPVLVWFLGLTTGTIQNADTYCWKVRADFEPETVFNDTSWWAFSTEQALVNPPPQQCNNDGICDAGENPTDCPQDCEGGGPGGGGTLENPISAENLTDLFNKIFSFLFGLAIFLVPVIVIYAAFLMLMGGGDPVKLAKGRMILLWTAIAFTIILLSRGLPAVFQSLL